MCLLTLSMTAKSFLKIQWELEQPISSRFLGLEVYCTVLELLSSALMSRRGFTPLAHGTSQSRRELAVPVEGVLPSLLKIYSSIPWTTASRFIKRVGAHLCNRCTESGVMR